MWWSSSDAPLRGSLRVRLACPVTGTVAVGSLGQRVHDRAGLERAPAWARCYQGLQRAADLSELLDFPANLFELGHGLLANVRAIGRRVGAQRQQFTNFPQREPDLLCLFDEADPCHHLRRVGPDPRSEWLPRPLDQRFPLLEPHGLDADARRTRGLADRQCLHGFTSHIPNVGSVPWYGIKDKLGPKLNKTLEGWIG